MGAAFPAVTAPDGVLAKWRGAPLLAHLWVPAYPHGSDVESFREYRLNRGGIELLMPDCADER